MSVFELRKKVADLKELSKDLSRRIDAQEAQIKTLSHLLYVFKRDIPQEWR